MIKHSKENKSSLDLSCVEQYSSVKKFCYLKVELERVLRGICAVSVQ